MTALSAAPVPAGGDPATDASPRKARTLDPQEVLTAAVTAMGGQPRTPQQAMTQHVADTVGGTEAVIVQAGTGTGKSLGYLCGTAAADGQVIISTATKQLSDQLHTTDLPALADAINTVDPTGPPLTYAVLKGRSNYLCLARLADLDRLEAGESDIDSLIDVDDVDTTGARVRRPSKKDLAELGKVRTWSRKTATGDRADAPAVSNNVWGQVSVDSSGCPGARLCPSGGQCFAEKARRAAASADVTVVNHALLAADLMSPQGLFDNAAGYVIDEVHEFTSSLSGTWELVVDPDTIHAAVRQARRRLPDLADKAAKVDQDIDVLVDVLNQQDDGRLTEVPSDLRTVLDGIRVAVTAMATAMTAATQDTGQPASQRIARVKTARALTDVTQALTTALHGADDQWVRHISRYRERVTLKVTPLQPGELFNALRGDRWVVATSATATIGGDFTPTAHALGLDDDASWRGEDVGTPFTWDTQAMCYIPGPGFPDPVGRERREHTTAFHDEALHLVTAAGGRALVLCTTVNGATSVAEHLRTHLPDTITVLAHGEAPASALAQQFADDETSVLCATMGMWAGLSIPGPSLTLVVIDKLPFAPQSDPVYAARREWIDNHGGNGFHDVYVTHAALLIAQAAGRLIRTTTDRGVVAICDRRILTKGYGRTIRATLPPMRLFHDRDLVANALTRLTGPPAGK